MPDKRLFIAIPLLTDFIDTLDQHFKRLGSFEEWRFVSKENWHITVLFLGYVKDADLTEIMGILRNVFSNTKQFALEFDEIVFAPPGRPPRMIWAQFKKSDEFQKLNNDLLNVLKKFIEKLSMRQEVVPHATLARLRQGFSGQSRLKNKIIPTKEMPHFEFTKKAFSVSQIYLMESKLSKSGPEYSIIESFILK